MRGKNFWECTSTPRFTSKNSLVLLVWEYLGLFDSSWAVLAGRKKVAENESLTRSAATVRPCSSAKLDSAPSRNQSEETPPSGRTRLGRIHT